MAAPLIIHDQRDRADQQEIVVMLADFSFTPPDQIFSELKKSGSKAQPAAQAGPPPSTSGIAKPGAAADPDVIKVEPGGRVLLRIINSSAMSAYHIDLGALVNVTP